VIDQFWHKVIVKSLTQIEWDIRYIYGNILSRGREIFESESLAQDVEKERMYCLMKVIIQVYLCDIRALLLNRDNLELHGHENKSTEVAERNGETEVEQCCENCSNSGPRMLCLFLLFPFSTLC
jgi:hypothetical protein